MLNTYFIHIAAVRMAAQLTKTELYDNYAFHGAISNFTDISLGKIEEADGIPDVPQKADSFLFGQACGKVIKNALSAYTEQQFLVFEADTVKGTFLKLTPENMKSYSEKELKDSLKTVFRALLKFAQIRTHTAKPGNEDINKWLSDYNALLLDFEPTLDTLINEIINPSEKNGIVFFDKNDKLISLSNSGSITEEKIQEALSEKPSSVFGTILFDILTSLPSL